MATTLTKAVFEAHLTFEEAASRVGLVGPIKNALEAVLVLTASTTPDAEKAYAGRVTLIAGAATLDLTALTDSEGTVLSMTAKKVRFFAIKGNGNANVCTIKVGAANGFTGFGTAWTIDVQVGGWIFLYAGAASVDIDATHKTIDFAGTLTQSFDVIIVAG
jgi:hypothetical protein